MSTATVNAAGGRRRPVLVLGAALAPVALILSLSAARAAEPGHPAHGHDLFAATCASCHGADLKGGEFGPPLSGPSFDGHWAGQPAAALASFISDRMPPSAAGTLSAADAADLVAYIRSTTSAGGGAAEVAAVPAPKPASAQAAPAGAPRPAARAFDDPGLQAAKAARLAPLHALAPVTDAMLRKPPEGDWLMWRRTYSTLGFSPLRQISKANVASLGTAWSWSLPASQNEITPLIHDGVLFVQSGDTVQALGAVKGDLLWQYVRALPATGAEARITRVKTMALYGERLYAAFVDGHVVALDVKTGKPVWDHAVLTDAEATNKGRADGVSFHLDGGPIVVHGKVILGVSLGTDTAKGGCFIVALDAAGRTRRPGASTPSPSPASPAATPGTAPRPTSASAPASGRPAAMIPT